MRANTLIVTGVGIVRNAFVPVCVLGLVLGLLAPSALCGDVAIAVSPGTVNLQSQATCVTVHADIPYDWVTGPVTLEGLVAASTFADDCGDLVAKFDVAAVKAMLEVELGDAREAMVTLTLSGDTIDGGTFSGSDTVRVIREGGKRK